MHCVCLLTGATEYITNKCRLPCAILKCRCKMHNSHKNWFVQEPIMGPWIVVVVLFCFVLKLFFFLSLLLFFCFLFYFRWSLLKGTSCAKLITNLGQKSTRIGIPGIQVTNSYTKATTQRVFTWYVSWKDVETNGSSGWGSETQTFGIQQVCKSWIATVRLHY